MGLLAAAVPNHPRRGQAGHLDFELTGAENDPSGNFRVGFEGKATINRKDRRVSRTLWWRVAGSLSARR